MDIQAEQVHVMYGLVISVLCEQNPGTYFVEEQKNHGHCGGPPVRVGPTSKRLCNVGQGFRVSLGARVHD